MYKPRPLDRRKLKTKELDKKPSKRDPVAPHLDNIIKAVEKGGGDTGADTVLGVLRQGRDNFEDIRKDADRRNRE